MVNPNVNRGCNRVLNGKKPSSQEGEGRKSESLVTCSRKARFSGEPRCSY